MNQTSEEVKKNNVNAPKVISSNPLDNMDCKYYIIANYKKIKWIEIGSFAFKLNFILFDLLLGGRLTLIYIGYSTHCL